ncbi:hypothetical protein ACRYCC_26450 [Actinomadura scrupuli]|uniref:hypothetical protein n=1 Tax=Actinomadura scrupuli TaxID=559629 RepID=UPI003D96545D
MTAEEFPADLVDLQCSFLAAEARCAELSNDQRAEFEATMEEMRQLAERLNDYWATVAPGTRSDARAALRKAARAKLAGG